MQVFSGYWGLEDTRRNPDWLFVFGDNDARRVGLRICPFVASVLLWLAAQAKRV